MLAAVFGQVIRERPFLMGWGLGEILVLIIVIAALLSIVYVAVDAMGSPIPAWVWKIIGIVIIAFVAIVAIKLVLSF